jgi:hypothetical protein
MALLRGSGAVASNDQDCCFDLILFKLLRMVLRGDWQLLRAPEVVLLGIIPVFSLLAIL